MNVFFTDLDGTLIFSHRRNIPGAKVPVEELDGRQQSFMTEKARRFFREAEWLRTVPVTTRTEAQWRRLQFPDDFRIRRALACNGGKLLIRGEEDLEWSAATQELAREDLPDLEEMGRLLGEVCGREPHRPENYYYYVKADEPERICTILEGRNRKGNILIGHDRRKVYLFPRSINKGTALRRFKERFPVGVSAAAGDSRMDLPMLEEADYPMAPAEIAALACRADVRALEGEILSDAVCEALESLHREGKI